MSTTATIKENNIKLQLTRVFQHAQMLRDRRQRHGIWPSQIGDATVAAGKMFEDAAARRIGQRGKRAVQQSRRTFNHMVKY